MFIPSVFAQNSHTSPKPPDLGDPSTDLFDYLPFLYDLLSYLPFVLGPLAVIMLIYSGLTFITSLGRHEKIKKAQKTFLHSLLGTVPLILFVLFLFRYFPLKEKIELPPLIP